jgi:hypothetical protein
MRSESTTPTEARLLPIARLFWPDLQETVEGDIERSSRLADVMGSLYAAPVALAGLVWLMVATDPVVIAANWPVLLVLLVLVLLLRRLMFAMFIEVRPGDHADLRGSLAGILSWSAALSFGPTALWLAVAGVISNQLGRTRRTSAPIRWNRARNLALELTEIAAGLAGLRLYQELGGAHLPFGDAQSIAAPALAATGLRYVLSLVVLSPLLLYWVRVGIERATEYRFGPYLAATVALPLLIDPFAVLVTVLHAEAGLGLVLFFSGGLLLVSLLANRLSSTALRSRQRATELARLEQLGRDLIGTPIDAAVLAAVLEDHVPVMLPTFQADIRLFPEQILYQYPDGHSPLPDAGWEWLRTTAEARCFLPGEEFPWSGTRQRPAENGQPPLLTAPILKPDSSEPVGGIALAQQTRMAWEAEEIARSLPAVQTLASQIGSALHGAELYRMEQELSLAGQIQASFLPSDLPQVPGWQITAALRPARETAGDFYDVIPLPNGRLGILIADVADKGMGAALYMALCRTLLRTYALEYHNRPDFVMKVTNRRILMDTDVTMFVTVFYGILDPAAGKLVYCNAGHNPPLLVRSSPSAPVETLTRTGMALGAFPALSWERGRAQIGPRGQLILYTDGMTDAQDAAGTFFGQDRLVEAARASAGLPARDVQDGLLRAVSGFSGESAQFDDITLLIAFREG